MQRNTEIFEGTPVGTLCTQSAALSTQRIDCFSLKKVPIQKCPGGSTSSVNKLLF